MNFKKALGILGLAGISTAAMAQDAAQAAEEAKDAFQQAVYQTRSLLFADEIAKYLTVTNLVKVVTAILAIVIFYSVYRFIRSVVQKGAAKKFEPHTVG